MRQYARVGCLLLCCVAVPIALSIPSAQSPVPELPGTLRLRDVEHVVTGLRVEQASTFLAATTACQTGSGWLAVGPFERGSDWNNGDGNGDRFVQFCVQRSRIQDPALVNVLQRIEVVSDTTECPPSLDKLFSPRANVAVCVGFASSELLPSLLASGEYINNIAVTKERNYNNQVPGWVTLPTSVHGSQDVGEAANRRVFISYQRPVVPITALEVVTSVEPGSVSGVCGKRFGLSWESAGQGFLDQGSSSSAKTVLCLERKIEALALRQLTDTRVVPASSSCPTGFSGRQLLSDRFALCSQWGRYRLPPSDTEYVADLVLLRVSSNESDTLDGQEPLPGSFVAASSDYNLNLVGNSTTVSGNATMASLYLRKTSSFASSWIETQASSAAKPPLRAKVNGSSDLSFKVLQIADMHYTGNPDTACSSAPASMTSCTERVMTQFIGELLDLEKPDFVVYSGDNVQVSDSHLRRTAMDTAVSGAESRGIPFGMVLGNHDDELGFQREDIIVIAESYNYSYTSRGPTSIDGIGNYELSVKAPASGAWGEADSDIFRMYFLDSHSYPNTTAFPGTSSKYDWVKQNQIDYYKRLSASHGTNGKVPSVMFFHIPIPEYAATTPNGTTGEQNEGVSSSDVNSNLFSSLVELNEVKATFVGHDHVNEFCSHRQGIALCYGGGVGFGAAYGSSAFARRARIIEWSINDRNQRTIRSWKRHYGDLSGKHNEEVLYTEITSNA